MIFYRGVKREDLSLDAAVRARPCSRSWTRTNTARSPSPTSATTYPDKIVVERFAELGTDMIVPLRTDKGSIGILLLPGSGNGHPVRACGAAVHHAHRALRLHRHREREPLPPGHHGPHDGALLPPLLREDPGRGAGAGAALQVHLQPRHVRHRPLQEVQRHLRPPPGRPHHPRDRPVSSRKSIRQVDFPARYGGEEFAVILPAVDIKGAARRGGEATARRSRRSPFPAPTEAPPLHVTISVGVTEFDPESAYAPSEIIREADRALYQSKEKGRNRVTVCRAPRRAEPPRKEHRHDHRSRAHHPGAGQEPHPRVPDRPRLHHPGDRGRGGDHPRRRGHHGHRHPRGGAAPRRGPRHPHHLAVQARLPGVPQGRHGHHRSGARRTRCASAGCGSSPSPGRAPWNRREQTMECAARVRESGAVLFRGGAWKPRTSPVRLPGPRGGRPDVPEGGGGSVRACPWSRRSCPPSTWT